MSVSDPARKVSIPLLSSCRPRSAPAVCVRQGDCVTVNTHRLPKRLMIIFVLCSPLLADSFRRRIQEAWSNLGSLLKDWGKGSKALAAFDSALSLDTAYVQAHYLRGLCKHGMGDHRGAQVDFKRGLFYDAKVWCCLGSDSKFSRGFSPYSHAQVCACVACTGIVVCGYRSLNWNGPVYLHGRLSTGLQLQQALCRSFSFLL